MFQYGGCIDGQERRLDYLGSEDSFAFSWGFQSTFAGCRAGMPLVKTGDLNLLSVYRFHDHIPIRFTKELTWSIDWKHEFWKTTQWLEPIRQRKQEGGCWVDYASVFYWCRDAWLASSINRSSCSTSASRTCSSPPGRRRNHRLRNESIQRLLPEATESGQGFSLAVPAFPESD